MSADAVSSHRPAHAAGGGCVPNSGISPRATSAPLARIEQELDDLAQRMAALAAGKRLPAAYWPDTLRRLQVHLFLIASQLLPLWRDIGSDSQRVDLAEVRLALLASLTDQTLGAGADDPLAQARCTVLAQELQQHQMRTSALLRALCTFVEPVTLQALTDVWLDEGRRSRKAQRQGLAVGMDNEDADPVGAPPR